VGKHKELAEAATETAEEPHTDCAEEREQLSVGAALLTTEKVLLHVEDRPEDREVEVHEIARPLLTYALATVTVPSAFSMQPMAPEGQWHLIAGGVAQHGSVPEAENVLVALGLQLTADGGAAQVMVGGSAFTETISEHVAPLPAMSETEQVTTRRLFAYVLASDTEPSALTVQPCA
jgi:hypothetical protein